MRWRLPASGSPPSTAERARAVPSRDRGAPAVAPRLLEVGDAALLVVLGETIDVELNARVHHLARVLGARHADDPSWGRPVPAYASLLVPYDPARLTVDQARRDLGELLASIASGGAPFAGGAPVAGGAPPAVDASGAALGEPSATASTSPIAGGPAHTIGVRYGGTDGPDLAEVAARLGLTEPEVVDRHTAAVYTVFMLGFTPGFPYLGPLPDALVLPRRATPRTSVPAGSVAIAGRQTGIYPAPTPGGWHLIGRTDETLWDPARDHPALLEPGDTVRFVAR
jgi:KipI family sensor histidine kinase inhibitor